MSMFKALISEIFGMFVDDGSLAFAVLAIIAIAYAVTLEFTGDTHVAGGILLVGCLAVLVENVVRTARRP
jgi:hypothetical protein